MRGRPCRLLAACLACLAASAAVAEPRVALVVGNNAYEEAPLDNPLSDAKLIEGTLRELGFEVSTARDADEDAMEEAIVRLGERLRELGPDAVGLFYYAGHGVQSSAGRNYLIPVGGARIRGESRLAAKAVSADWVLETMRNSGNAVNVLILDACRNNPYVARRGARGLAAMVPGSDSLIAFSAAAGQTAEDGDGGNSAYAAALAAEMRVPGLTFAQVFQNVRKRVLERQRHRPADERQTPTEVSQLTRDHYFVPPSGAPVRISQPHLPDPAAEMWKQIREAGDASLVREFLASYPDSEYGGAARALLIRLSRQPFTVETEPAGAQVRILNIEERYRRGMELAAGDYRVEASLDGHGTVVRTVRHASTPTLHRIVLRRSVVRRSAGERFRDCADCPEMVVIPAGRFEMGCDAEDCEDNEKPVHEVRIRNDFALGRYEVTVGEFRRFAEAAGYRTDAEKDAGQGCYTMEIMDRNKWGWTPGRSWRNLEYALEDRQPVTCVSWNDAKAYVVWLGERTGAEYRLPSEAEWEYAVRVGTRTRYHFGDASERLCAYGNVADRTKLPNGDVRANGAECEDGAVYPTAVGSYRPNAFGLYDMHGNVWEWVEDCWNGSYAGAPPDGVAWVSGDCAKRVLRGGSWNYDPRYLRAAYRGWSTTGDRGFDDGFRVARTLTP